MCQTLFISTLLLRPNYVIFSNSLSLYIFMQNIVDTCLLSQLLSLNVWYRSSYLLLYIICVCYHNMSQTSVIYSISLNFAYYIYILHIKHYNICNIYVQGHKNKCSYQICPRTWVYFNNLK